MATEQKIPQNIDDRPHIKYLNRYVRTKLCGACNQDPQAWKNVGIELMPDSDAQLNAISANSHGNVFTCVSSLFDLWLQRKPNATWGHLIEALNIAGIDYLATEIEGMLEPSAVSTAKTETTKPQIQIVTYQTSNSDKAPSSPDSRITASNLQPELLSSKDTLDFGLHNQSSLHTSAVSNQTNVTKGKMLGAGAVGKGSLPAQSSQPSVRSTRSSTMPTNTLPTNLLKRKNCTPLVTALQSGNHHIKWTKCADLPFAMSYASVVVDRQKETIYVTPGSSTDATVYNKVFNLDMKTGGWNELPSPDHRFGILQIINRKLCIIGGSHVATRKYIKKVSTYDEESKRWIQFYPDMLSPRFKPGVVTYGDHVVVLGGTKDNDSINDDIEMFNWRLAITQRNVQWQRSALTLPVPMWGISPTIVDEHLYIVGYTQPKGTSNRPYRLSINLLQQPQHTRALDRQAVWSELSRAPHFFTALVPELYPPIVVGGGNGRADTATSDVCLYDISDNEWKKVASLPNARLSTTVATIDKSTIIVFGGYTNGKTTQSAMDTCIATVEIGQAESIYYA